MNVPSSTLFPTTVVGSMPRPTFVRELPGAGSQGGAGGGDVERKDGRRSRLHAGDDGEHRSRHHHRRRVAQEGLHRRDGADGRRLRARHAARPGPRTEAEVQRRRRADAQPSPPHRRRGEVHEGADRPSDQGLPPLPVHPGAAHVGPRDVRRGLSHPPQLRGGHHTVPESGAGGGPRRRGRRGPDRRASHQRLPGPQRQEAVRRPPRRTWTSSSTA